MVKSHQSSQPEDSGSRSSLLQNTFHATGSFCKREKLATAVIVIGTFFSVPLFYQAYLEYSKTKRVEKQLMEFEERIKIKFQKLDID